MQLIPWCVKEKLVKWQTVSEREKRLMAHQFVAKKKGEAPKQLGDFIKSLVTQRAWNIFFHFLLRRRLFISKKSYSGDKLIIQQ